MTKISTSTPAEAIAKARGRSAAMTHPGGTSCEQFDRDVVATMDSYQHAKERWKALAVELAESLKDSRCDLAFHRVLPGGGITCPRCAALARFTEAVEGAKP